MRIQAELYRAAAIMALRVGVVLSPYAAYLHIMPRSVAKILQLLCLARAVGGSRPVSSIIFYHVMVRVQGFTEKGVKHQIAVLKKVSIKV
jgi:hypothetical protein